jgi:hypothetical protein
MPSVFLQSFYSTAPVSCSHFVTQSSKYEAIALLGLFEDTVHHGGGDEKMMSLPGKKKTRLSQSPTFLGEERSQISSNLAQL